MSAFRIGVRLPAARPVPEMIATVRRAEAAGIDAAWFPDSHLNYREVWSTLGAIAVSTATIELGLTVTNLVSRHPTVTASAARTVAEASAGRFVLGLGAGDSAVGFDGLRHSTAKQVQEGVAVVRALTRGEPVRYGEFEATLRDASVSVPIYVAASGPRMLRSAGAVADGVIITLGDNDRKLQLIADGAADSGRDAPPPVFVYTGLTVTEDIERFIPLLKPGCLRIAQLEGVGMFTRLGLRVELPDDHVVGAPGDVGHAADPAAAARQVESLVSDGAAMWFARNRTLMGTAEQVAGRIQELARSGIAGVTLTGLGNEGVPAGLIESVLPLLT